MSKQLFTKSIVVVLALAAAGIAAADDRDFLREVAAAPNLIFILDTSGSMVASPEIAALQQPLADCDPTALVLDTDDPPDGIPDAPDPYGCSTGLRVPFTMLPGGGDDPASRMGIAKRVLRDFLENLSEANVALAGYAQRQPDLPELGIAQKHWVYEARAQDRFHMIEATYAYRLGYSESHDGILLDVPADIMKNRLIGYKLYHDPETTPLEGRYGPVNAFDSGFVDTAGGTATPMPYDLLPIYFGNCFTDNKETPGDPSDDVTICGDGVFPFYDSGVRETTSGDLIPTSNYYGELDDAVEDYPGCDPTDPIWDDGFGSPVAGACENAWEMASGADIIQYQRRVRLEIPDTWGGNPNHFLGTDSGGAPVGNLQASDGGSEDYDLDTFADPDIDGDAINDWILYVNSVEERMERTCSPAATLPTWTPTLTPTPTFTVTPTPTLSPTPTLTPTPLVYCNLITIDGLRTESTYNKRATIHNGLNSIIDVVRTVFTWTPRNGTHYVDFFSLDYMSTWAGYNAVYWDGTDYGPVTIATGTINPLAGDIAALDSSTYWYAKQNTYPPADSYTQVCLDFRVRDLPTPGANFLCPDICAEQFTGSYASPTPTVTETWTPEPLPSPSITPTPSLTPTRTPFGWTPSPTRTPSNTPTPAPATPTRTNPPLPTITPTPFPPTATPTPIPPTKTFTPFL